MSAEHQWRWQPLLEQWVLIAATSGSRPWSGASTTQVSEAVPEHDPNCYLCPGVTRASGGINPNYAAPWAFDNDFASLVPVAPTADETNRSDDPLNRTAPPRGRCRVLCWHPSHNKTLAACSEQEIVDVAKLWQSEYASLSSDDSIAQVMMFENKGKEVGVSNLHPHGQIYAANAVSDYGQRIRQSQHQYAQANNGQPLLQALLARDEYKDALLVEQGSYFKTIVPFAARLPFETWIVPLRHVQSVNRLDSAELLELSLMYQRQVRRYDQLFQRSSPLLTLFQNAPCDTNQANADWCFHIALQPPLRDSDTLKYFAGYEASSNNVVNPVQPEKAAAALRGCDPDKAQTW